MKKRTLLLVVSILCIFSLYACNFYDVPAAENTGSESITETKDEGLSSSETSEQYNGNDSSIETSEQQNGSDTSNDNSKQPTSADTVNDDKEQIKSNLTFRKHSYLTQHFEKHGSEVDCDSEEEYLEKANAVIDNPNALTKTEAEDGDLIYYIEATNEIVFVSTDGYIRTYFKCKNKAYFDRQ